MLLEEGYGKLTEVYPVYSCGCESETVATNIGYIKVVDGFVEKYEIRKIKCTVCKGIWNIKILNLPEEFIVKVHSKENKKSFIQTNGFIMKRYFTNWIIQYHEES